MDHLDSVILPGQPVAKARTAIRGTIVNQNNLQVPVCLLPYGTDAFFQIRLNIIYRHNNRNQIRLFLLRYRTE